MNLTNRIHELSHTPIHLKKEHLKMFRRIGYALMAVLFCFALSSTLRKNFRWHAAQAKPDFSRAIDATSNFGTVRIVDSRITRWNHGMTVLTGWTSKEMVGERISILAPDDASPINDLDRAVIDNWVYQNYVDLKRKDESTVRVRLNGTDISDTEQPPFRELRFDQLGVEHEEQVLSSKEVPLEALELVPTE